ncbi:MAG: peptidylprolyl isomerase, partial [Planctomycetota bacterium]
NIKLLETAAKSGEASNKVPAQPQETVVVQPEFDPASGSWKPFGNPIIAFETRYGRVRFELFEDAAPNTVANIIHLVRSGFYNLDGPGGSIKRAGTATHPGMLTVGEFPAIDSATRTQNYDKLKDTNQRVKRLDRKLWESLFNVRSLNYTIPFEHSGAQRPVVAGSLVMKLALVSGDYGAPRPDSASFSFNIMAAPAPDMDLKYVVFGRVLDTPEHDSSGVLRRLGDVSDIQLAWIERIRPAMVARQIVLADGANEVVKSPEHVTRNSEGYLVPAAGSGGTSWIALYPGQAESIPTGEQYMAPAGLVQGTRFPAWGDMITPGADVTTPTVVRYHAAERAPLLARIGRMQAPMTSLGSATMLSFAALANRTSVVLLPATRPVLKDGKATAKVYTPRVQYTGWPNLVDARAAHAPPAPLNKPLELFGPRPGAPPGGGPGAMPPGGMPPGIPGLPPGMEGFPGDRGIPGIPGN